MLIFEQVFSFSNNKIARLPPYFSQFRRLEVLNLDRNPMEWPPRNVLQGEIGGDDEMEEWIADLLDWVDYKTSRGFR